MNLAKLASRVEQRIRPQPDRDVDQVVGYSHVDQVVAHFTFEALSLSETITALFVRQIKRPGRYCDGGNLYLQVRKSTGKKSPGFMNKSWAFRYVRDDKQTWMGLGPYPDVSSVMPASWRQRRASSCSRASIRWPTNGRGSEKHGRLSDMLSFAECAEQYIDAQAPGWSNPKHIDQWRNTLKNVAGPVFGHLPVDQVDTALVMRCIEPLWTSRTETASRLRGRIESVLDWATVRGYRAVTTRPAGVGTWTSCYHDRAWSPA